MCIAIVKDLPQLNPRQGRRQQPGIEKKLNLKLDPRRSLYSVLRVTEDDTVLDLQSPLTDDDTVLDLQQPTASKDKTLELQQPTASKDKTLELQQPTASKDKTLELQQLSIESEC
jgi:hypothetical protein